MINPDGNTIEIKTEGSIRDILKTDECYVLVADDLRKVFLWKGVTSSVRSKFIGVKRSQEIRGQVGMHYAVVPLDEGDEDAEFLNLIGGQTEAGYAKEISDDTIAAPSVHPLREKNVFGTPKPAEGMNIAGSQSRSAQKTGSLYTGKSLMSTYQEDQSQVDFQDVMQKLEEIQIPPGFERDVIIIGNNAYTIVERVDSFLGKKTITKEISRMEYIPEAFLREEENYSHRIISKEGKILAIAYLKRTRLANRHIEGKSKRSLLKKNIEEQLDNTGVQKSILSNKDRILNLLKSEDLSSKEIADKLSLSKQDARTYLLRLKKEDKIKILGKKGRYNIYSYKTPSNKEVPYITTDLLAHAIKEYIEFNPSFKKEINKKVAEIEANLVVPVSSESKDFSKSKKKEINLNEFQKNATYNGNGEKLELFESISMDKILSLLEQVKVPEGYERKMVIVNNKLFAYREYYRNYLGSMIKERQLFPLKAEIEDGPYLVEDDIPRKLFSFKKVVITQLLQKIIK